MATTKKYTIQPRPNRKTITQIYGGWAHTLSDFSWTPQQIAAIADEVMVFLDEHGIAVSPTVNDEWFVTQKPSLEPKYYADIADAFAAALRMIEVQS